MPDNRHPAKPNAINTLVTRVTLGSIFRTLAQLPSKWVPRAKQCRGQGEMMP
jgi:hypothetical protein